MRVHLPKGANDQYDAALREQSYQKELLSHPRTTSIRSQLRSGGPSIEEYKSRSASMPPLAHLWSGSIPNGTHFIALALRLSKLLPLY